MKRHLSIAKNLWNDLLEHCKQIYHDYDKFPTRNSIALMTKKSGLFSQVAQEVGFRVGNSIWKMINLKKKGVDCGFPRFKSFDRMKSLKYPQAGFFLGRKLRVTPFGEIAIVRHREIKGMIKTLSLKREASGKWFACFAVEEIQAIKEPNCGPRVGMDLGLKALATLSDGTVIENPGIFKKHQERLAQLQRQTDGKKKGSSNRKKMKKKVALAYEKVKNTRTDFLHKLSHNLVNLYSFIALEDLESQEMAKQNFGKSIYDAGWGMLANMISYKAEEAGCEVVFVNPEGTTKTCCKCGSKKDIPLRERRYFCESCGNDVDRDLNAACNILKRATAGIAGSNACGDGTVVPSLKQEARASRCG